jgi:hypothetical protein
LRAAAGARPILARLGSAVVRGQAAWSGNGQAAARSARRPVRPRPARRSSERPPTHGREVNENRIHRPRHHGAPDGAQPAARGHQLTVWARRAESMQPLLDAGAGGAASPAGAGRAGCGPGDLDGGRRARCRAGDAGRATAWRVPAGQDWMAVDMSTIRPAAARAIASATAGKRNRFSRRAGFRRRGRRDRGHAVDHGRRQQSPPSIRRSRRSRAWEATSCTSAIRVPAKWPRPPTRSSPVSAS